LNIYLFLSNPTALAQIEEEILFIPDRFLKPVRYKKIATESWK
jgi:hypothetical protein